MHVQIQVALTLQVLAECFEFLAAGGIRDYADVWQALVLGLASYFTHYVAETVRVGMFLHYFAQGGQA